MGLVRLVIVPELACLLGGGFGCSIVRRELACLGYWEVLARLLYSSSGHIHADFAEYVGQMPNGGYCS